MGYAKNIVAGLLIGAGVGYFSGKINQPSYTLHEKDESSYLFSKSNNKSYEIDEVSNNFYLGGFEHNLNGLRVVSYFNGLSEKKDELFDERQKNNDLEEKLNEQSQMIRRRRFFDKIDETKDKIDIIRYKIKLWYNDLKRRQLDE
jgi:uncharacterized membrane protein